MPLGPMNKGDTAPRANFLFKQGTNYFDLTQLAQSAIVVHLWQPSTQTHKRGGGKIYFTDALNGRCQYAWNAEDTDTAGIWEVWAELITADGPASSTNVEILEITDRPKGFNPKHFSGRALVQTRH